ncbi:TPA: hypothetical protein EYP38_00935 [Candidatus Micrarchaeota archaeon]|nr:hypothetical protein [Candidatus Micrarchaeota archaeon]
MAKLSLLRNLLAHSLCNPHILEPIALTNNSSIFLTSLSISHILFSSPGILKTLPSTCGKHFSHGNPNSSLSEEMFPSQLGQSPLKIAVNTSILHPHLFILFKLTLSLIIGGGFMFHTKHMALTLVLGLIGNIFFAI